MSVSSRGTHRCSMEMKNSSFDLQNGLIHANWPKTYKYGIWSRYDISNPALKPHIIENADF